MAILIETASIQHLEKLCEIEVECFGREAFTRQQIAHLLRDYHTISLIAKEGELIVGFIVGRIHLQEDAFVGHVLTIDVSAKYRRKQIGLRLLQEIERILVGKNVRTCHLEVREDNVQALSLYEKVGYRRIGRLENYYGNAHGLHLKKELVHS